MAYDEPGFKKIPCPGKNELRPNHRNAQPARGVLAYIGHGTANVFDMGAPKDQWGYSTISPASPTFTADPPIMPAAPVERDQKPATIMPGIKRH